MLSIALKSNFARPTVLSFGTKASGDDHRHKLPLRQELSGEQVLAAYRAEQKAGSRYLTAAKVCAVIGIIGASLLVGKENGKQKGKLEAFTNICGPFYDASEIPVAVSDPRVGRVVERCNKMAAELAPQASSPE